MLYVTMNEPQFEYDIHSLVKAFYPEADVKVVPDQEVLFDESSDREYPAICFTASPQAMRMQVWVRDRQETVKEESIPLWEGEPRPETKNRLKLMVYGLLSAHTEKTLPWGTLTGIRPTKIAMGMLEEGKDAADIVKYMKETYATGEEKALLSIEIAEREKKLLSGIHYREGYSLYIGIPFCPTTCLYCSFTSYPIVSYRKRVAEYLEALEREMEFLASACRDRILDTVYIGGGTPTTLEPEELERLLSRLKSLFDFSSVQEFTVEAGRADSITTEKLRVLKKHGVTRISVNPQTMNADTLLRIGRQATPDQVRDAFAMAREEGFDNINMDLILGLPGETDEDVRKTMEEIRKMEPDSLTVHSLAIKRGSKLAQWIPEHGMDMLCNTEETMRIAAAGAAEMNLEPYYLYRQKNMTGNLENVGYARPGCYGIYNILMMEEKQDILAAGAGCISKVLLGEGRIERCDTVKDVGLYIEKIEEMIERKKTLIALKNLQ